MRLWARQILGSTALATLVVATCPVAAQDTATDPPTVHDTASGDTPSSATAATTASSPSAGEAPADAAIRVAVVLVGDPNDDARRAALQVEDALRGVLTLPSDASLRESLLGSTGEDTIAPVVRDRRALGGTERDDLPLLSNLGDRADVVLLLVVRARAGQRELVGFDVRHRAFFDGSVTLTEDASAARILRFARARGRVALSSGDAQLEADAALAAQTSTQASTQASAETASTQGQAQQLIALPDAPAESEPDWLEVNWPYLVAGALLAGAAAFVIVYTSSGSDPVPMLRFRPGGTP